jgi:glycerol-1-phosphate dehydrogenase [NAD(P)+]
MSAAPARVDGIEQLLRGDFPDPDGGGAIAIPIKSIVIADTLRGAEADVVRPLALGQRLAVVSDPATHGVLGARVESALSAIATIVPVRLQFRPHADARTAAAVRRACESVDALVAVGSGTINDLCKYAAAQDGKPYVVFATAPSMNGYTSMNAAITVDGHKRSLGAKTPVGVFIDLQVLANAPARMIRAGLGDSLCRPTAQADWLLSHYLLGTPYRSAPFCLLAADEAKLFDASEELLAGDLEAMRALARTLVLSGLGMTICGGSYPASQGEHLISHYIDMCSPPGRADYFHGEQVAVATLTMASIQQRMLAAGPPALEPPAVTELDLCQRLARSSGRLAGGIPAQAGVGGSGCNDLRARSRLVGRSAETGRRGCRAADRLARIMARAEGPTTPTDIGLGHAFYARAVRDARFLRDRYTFLDLADDCGCLDRWWPV